MTNKKFTISKSIYEKAIKIIPSATQTYSKSSANFVHNAAPYFLESGDGAYVWDVDGNKYIDYIIALLPNILGYCDKDVNNAIIKQLSKGISFSLATPLELELSEILVDLIPSAEMVRFGKNGSDVTTSAIRLARAYTNRDRLIVCGYHGWHDWYIGSTKMNCGVPKQVSELTDAIDFNDLDSLENLLKNRPNEYAALIIEPEGVCEQNDGFLQKVRDLTNKYGVVLIFDEIVTGFRVHIGGAQAKYNVIPDLTTIGKSMANGMPMSALVGRKDIMASMDKIFYSGTFGGETLSIIAAITTIQKIQDKGITEKLLKLGRTLKQSVSEVILNNNLQNYYSITGPDWRPFINASEKSDVPKNILVSILRQEYILNGMLFGNAFNLSYSHISDDVFSHTMTVTKKVFEGIKINIASGDVEKKLKGPPIGIAYQVRK